MKAIRIFALFLLLFSSSALGQQYASLYIQHPQNTWIWGQGTIENATLYAYQKGVYTQNDLFLTFSARDMNLLSTDSVEVQLMFQLPADAIVTDSWLLINDVLTQGKIMDRWTASGIYEGIVKRRRDPSVLYKDYSDYYQLRVYPLQGTGTRTVKISYLTKNEWTAKSVISPLPTNILRASKTMPSTWTLRCYPSNSSAAPFLMELPGITGTSLTDTGGHAYYQFNIAGADIPSSLSLVLPSPLQNGIFVSRYQNGNDGVYQLALTPWKSLNVSQSRRVALLFDYDQTRSHFTPSDVLNAVRLFLMDNFTASDSVNLIFSGAATHRLYQHWIGGDSASIAGAFELMGSSPFSGYSNLPSLLADGIDFVQENRGGVIWLIANTDQVWSAEAGNALINDLMKLMPAKIPFHICDFNEYSYQYLYINGISYQGNQFFYDNLSRLTNGSNKRIPYNGSLSGILGLSAAQLRGKLEASDVYTTLESGFCYGRIPIGTTGLQAIGLDETILQTGKFNGTFPLVVDIAGIVGDSVISRQISVTAAQAITDDSVALQVWAGNYVATLEEEPYSNDIVRQIIAVSLTNRVLTRYTAFLCLDPSDTANVCTSCSSSNTGPVIGVVQKEKPPATPAKDSLLQAYPNPFNSQTVLQVRLPLGVRSDQVSLRVYNMLGQIVFTFPTSSLNDRATTKVTWNGRNDNNLSVSSGVYFVVLNTPKGRFATKLLMLK